MLKHVSAREKLPLIARAPKSQKNDRGIIGRGTLRSLNRFVTMSQFCEVAALLVFGRHPRTITKNNRNWVSIW
jgi:hypothetical protein